MKQESNFDDLVQAIQDAFIKVNNMSEAQHLQKISAYFDDEHNAKVFAVNYPSFDENGVVVYKELNVPQICLLPMSSLKLDEVEVDFKVRLYGGVKIKKGKEAADLSGNVEKENHYIGGHKLQTQHRLPENNTFLGYFPQGGGRKSQDENYANIKLKFVSDEPPEGLMRIQDQFTKIIL